MHGRGSAKSLAPTGYVELAPRGIRCQSTIWKPLLGRPIELLRGRSQFSAIRNHLSLVNVYERFSPPSRASANHTTNNGLPAVALVYWRQRQARLCLSRHAAWPRRERLDEADLVCANPRCFYFKTSNCALTALPFIENHIAQFQSHPKPPAVPHLTRHQLQHKRPLE